MALKVAAREGAGDNEEVVEEEIPETRESAIEAAWAEHEEPEGDEEPVVEAAEETPVEEEEEKPAKEEKPVKRVKDPKTGKFLKAKAPAEGEEPVVEEKTPEELEAEAAAAAEEEQKLPQERQTVKPLLSWRPLERAALNKVATTAEGKLVLAAVQRREAQMEGALKETQGIREFTNGFSRVMAPHQPLLNMLKVHPLDAVNELMRSAAVLYGGDAKLKAREVALLMQQRGIDPSDVADVLEGIAPKGPPADPRLDQALQRVQQLEQHLQTSSTAEDQRQQEIAVAKVAKWSKDKPFFEDVRGRMRTLITAGDADGQELSLDEAYAIACSMDPQISKLVEQKKAADGLKARQVALEKARKAGKSTKPDGSRRPSGTPTGDRTSDIESAWEEVEGR